MNNKYSVATTEKEARLSVFRSEHHVNLHAEHGSDALPVF